MAGHRLLGQIVEQFGRKFFQCLIGGYIGQVVGHYSPLHALAHFQVTCHLSLYFTVLLCELDQSRVVYGDLSFFLSVGDLCFTAGAQAELYV